MLAISFFCIIFSSLLWLIFALRFISDSLGGTAFFDAGAVNVLIYVLIACLPVLLMWMVFAFINQYLNSRTVNIQLQKLFGQMKRNQDYSDLLARVMIETEQQVKDGFILGKFDLLVADMNEMLAEIIRNCNIASGEQIERLWNKVQNGGKWSFGKVIIEVNNSQPNFQRRIFERAAQDNVLAGTIMEFCARYLAVVAMLEKHDKEKLFLTIIETGVMGKVFSIFAPVSDEVRKVRESAAMFRPQTEKEITAPRPAASAAASRPYREPEEEEEKKPALLDKINIFKKKNAKEEEITEPAAREEKDPFSIALERSFGREEPKLEAEEPQFSFNESSAEEEMPVPRLNEPVETANEPRFDPASEAETEIRFDSPLADEAVNAKKEEEEELLATQKTLNNLRQEWANRRATLTEETAPAPEAKAEGKKAPDEDINLAYPFGGWTDEQNYNK